MSNKTYLCTLQPLGKFFFGGEKTFGQAGSTQTNYLVRSNPFPQQTTLLGMIRFELLRQNTPRLLPISTINQTDVNVKIGPESFKIGGNPKGFGIIESLSPLFIRKGKTNYLLAPRDEVSLDDKNKNEIRKTFTNALLAEKAYRYGKGNTFKEIKQTEVSSFHHKDYYEDHFLNVANSSDSIRFEKIFIDDSQIGIEKKKTQADAKGFYKQFYFKMTEEFCFAFFLKTSQKITEVNNQIVFMGADKSAFALCMKEDTSFFDTLSRPKSIGTKITLLSDAYVEQSIFDACDFALGDTTTFRNIETTTHPSQNYDKSIMKSLKVLHLLKRGSVLYINDLSAAQTELEKDKSHFIKIGYNIYKID